MKITIDAVRKAVNGTPDGIDDSQRVVDTARVCFDTRKLVPGDIFIALTSEKQDGAMYIKEALAKGAVFAIAERNPEACANVLIVKNALLALQALARYVRSEFKGFIVGITGSSGKTTSKDLVTRMLSAFGKTVCNEGSFNNHIGTPTSLCKLDNDAVYAVFEMGMDHAGEISALVDMVRPNLAAITNVFAMHMENFKEFKDIAFAKAEIFEKVLPFNNRTIAVVNADTNFADDVLIPEARWHGIKEIITFGKKGAVKLKDYAINENCKTDVTMELGGKIYQHQDLGLGERFAYNANFALAVASAMRLDLSKALEALADFSPLKGRGKISTVSVDAKFTITLIDDSYNGQPEAMRYAVATLHAIPKNGMRKIAILGKMGEIGQTSEDEHRSVGKALANSDVDIVIGVGAEAKYILEELPKTKTAYFRENVDGLYEDLQREILRPNDIVLIKGAHYSSRVFEIADRLLAA